MILKSIRFSSSLIQASKSFSSIGIALLLYISLSWLADSQFSWTVCERGARYCTIWLCMAPCSWCALTVYLIYIQFVWIVSRIAFPTSANRHKLNVTLGLLAFLLAWKRKVTTHYRAFRSLSMQSRSCLEQKEHVGVVWHAIFFNTEIKIILINLKREKEIVIVTSSLNVKFFYKKKRSMTHAWWEYGCCDKNKSRSIRR